MATRQVTASAANAARNPESFLWAAASIVNQLVAYLTEDGVIAAGGLAVDSTEEKFQLEDTAVYTLGGATLAKAPEAALEFSAAHVVTAEKFGAILVQVDADGDVSTLIGESTQTTPMAYDTAALAIAELPDAADEHVALGYIVVEAPEGDTWTANTDDLVASSDAETVAFVDAQVKAALDTIDTDLGTPA